MATNALIGRLLRRWRELRAANGANVTITFALATIPIVGFVGAAVDYSHANSVKAAIQAAVDATGLMLSKEVSGLSESQLQSKAEGYFKALFTRPEALETKITVAYTSGESQVLVTGTAKVKTDFMGIMGFNYLPVSAQSLAKWGNTRLRVALALDVTGSMAQDGKMDALKIAAKNLLDQLKGAATNTGDVYVSIIPFNKDVNVGKANFDKIWVRWDLWEEDNGNCTGYSGSGKPKTKSKCNDRGGTWTADSHDTWNGCVTDRDKDYDTKNTSPTTTNAATLFPAEQYSSCPTQLIELSYDWLTLKAKVDSLTSKGNTNQGIGIQWAFQSLTASPFIIPPKDPKYKYTEVIILMSDGLNTENRYSSSQSAIDAREALTCTNAKAAGITIYSVQVNTGGDPTQTVMKNCASDPSKFFELKQANQLISTFNSIGTALSNLRIAK